MKERERVDVQHRLVIDSLIILGTLVYVRITRIPGVSTHKATAIDLSLVTPDLAVNCTSCTEENCLGSDHIPVMMELNDFLSSVISIVIGKHFRYFFYLLT